MLPKPFLNGQIVTYKSQHLLPTQVRAKIVKHLPNGLYQLSLLEPCEIIDPQTGETFPKLPGDCVYGKQDQLSKINNLYLVLYRNNNEEDEKLERELRAFAESRDWHFEIGGVLGTDFIGSDWPLPYINTSSGSFVGRNGVETFLEIHRV